MDQVTEPLSAVWRAALDEFAQRTRAEARIRFARSSGNGVSFRDIDAFAVGCPGVPGEEIDHLTDAGVIGRRRLRPTGDDYNQE